MKSDRFVLSHLANESFANIFKVMITRRNYINFSSQKNIGVINPATREIRGGQSKAKGRRVLPIEDVAHVLVK